MADAEKTELEIDETRSKYIPVATRTQLLFFCTTDLSNIDPMYQYSLEWYISIFLGSIASAEKSGACHKLLTGSFKLLIQFSFGFSILFAVVNQVDSVLIQVCSEPLGLIV